MGYMEEPQVKSDFYTIQEFANKLGVHSNTIRRLVKKGKINVINLGTGKRYIYRIPHSEINRIAVFDLEKIIVRYATRVRITDDFPSP